MTEAPPRFRNRRFPDLDGEVRLWGCVLLVFAVTAFVAWSYLPPPLPKAVRLGTGPVGGHYARFGAALSDEVAEHAIELTTVATAGSGENIRLLLSGEIDVGLVQSGNLSDAEAAQLASIATVFYEPVLLVHRADASSDANPSGRIAIGVPGSGAYALAQDLLEGRGVQDGVPPGTRLVEIGGERAVEALLTGEVDSAVFVTSLEVPWVRALIANPDLRLTHFELAEAFTRHYRYLRRLVIPAGLVDLRSRIPAHDVQVIATTASLVIRPGAHRALIPLLIDSAREQLYQGDLLASAGEFPSAYGVEAPLADEALDYFEQGPTFFYRWLPFRYAFAATRLVIILLPLLTLLYPPLRSAGPIYRWIIERRVYRWYRVLRKFEQAMDAAGDAATLTQIHKELERVDDEIRATHVPAHYGAILFGLRTHHKLLMDRLESLQAGVQGA